MNQLFTKQSISKLVGLSLITEANTLTDKEVSFYSDNCSGQTRNRFVFALLAFASNKYNMKITQRFLQVGHTQNEGNSMLSVIEKSKKKHVIFTPDQIYAAVRNAKVNGKPYVIK